MNNNPILLLEDDVDDCNFLIEAFKEAGIKNEFHCFDDAAKALEYLTTTNEKTFLIISDINMPKMTGLEFKKAINDNDVLNNKRIPFIFLSTSSVMEDIKEAYKLCANGYFKKPNNMDAYKTIANNIMQYWIRNEISEEI